MLSLTLTITATLTRYAVKATVWPAMVGTESTHANGGWLLVATAAVAVAVPPAPVEAVPAETRLPANAVRELRVRRVTGLGRPRARRDARHVWGGIAATLVGRLCALPRMPTELPRPGQYAAPVPCPVVRCCSLLSVVHVSSRLDSSILRDARARARSRLDLARGASFIVCGMHRCV
jgi:hypothetical protein